MGNRNLRKQILCSHEHRNIASCVLGSPKYFGRPKTTCSGCEPEAVSSKVGNPNESQITNR
jgi:hypothetical protein